MGSGKEYMEKTLNAKKVMIKLQIQTNNSVAGNDVEMETLLANNC